MPPARWRMSTGVSTTSKPSAVARTRDSTDSMYSLG
jgi:hypothetical protein